MNIRALMFLVAALALTGFATDSRAEEELPIVTLIKSKVKDPSKPFALWVTFKVKEGKAKEFEAAFVPCLAATKKEPGCISYELNHDPDHPEIYVMFEKFKGIDAIVAHMKQKHTETLLSTVGPMCEAAPQVKVYSVPE